MPIREESDPRVDQAIMIKPHIDNYTQQEMKEVIPYTRSLDELRNLSMILINDAQNRVNQIAATAALPPRSRIRL